MEGNAPNEQLEFTTSGPFNFIPIIYLASGENVESVPIVRRSSSNFLITVSRSIDLTL